MSITVIDFFHQYQVIKDWDLLAAHTDAVYMKVSDGGRLFSGDELTHLKRSPATYVAELVQRGVDWSPYHFWRPHVDQRTQVETFAQAVKDIGNPYTWPPVCDFEVWPTDNARLYSDLLHKFLQMTEDTFGVRPIIYSRSSLLKLLEPIPGGWEQYPIILASWWDQFYRQRWEEGLAEKVLQNSPYIPPPWDSFLGWQYTHKGYAADWGYDVNGDLGLGTSKSVDLNAFPVTIEQLRAMLGGTMPPIDPPPDPQPPEPPEWEEIELPAPLTEFVVTAPAGLNIRKGPGTHYTRIEAVPRGTRMKITDAVKDTNYIWGQMGLYYFAILRRDRTYFALPTDSYFISP